MPSRISHRQLSWNWMPYLWLACWRFVKSSWVKLGTPCGCQTLLSNCWTNIGLLDMIASWGSVVIRPMQIADKFSRIKHPQNVIFRAWVSEPVSNPPGWAAKVLWRPSSINLPMCHVSKSFWETLQIQLSRFCKTEWRDEPTHHYGVVCPSTTVAILHALANRHQTQGLNHCQWSMLPLCVVKALCFFKEMVANRGRVILVFTSLRSIRKLTSKSQNCIDQKRWTVLGTLVFQGMNNDLFGEKEIPRMWPCEVQR